MDVQERLRRIRKIVCELPDQRQVGFLYWAAAVLHAKRASDRGSLRRGHGACCGAEPDTQRQGAAPDSTHYAGQAQS